MRILYTLCSKILGLYCNTIWHGYYCERCPFKNHKYCPVLNAIDICERKAKNYD